MTKTFLLRVTVTLTLTEVTLVTQTSHSGKTIQTVLLYLYRMSQWVMTNRGTPH